MPISLASPTTAAFPHLRPGRLPHYTFRGLLSVHCTLRPGWSPNCPRQPSTSEASAISLPPSLLRLLPAGATFAGWDSHPLKRCTLARRTVKPMLQDVDRVLILVHLQVDTDQTNLAFHLIRRLSRPNRALRLWPRSTCALHLLLSDAQ